MANFVWALDDGYGDNKGHNGRLKLLVPAYATRWRPKPKAELGSKKEILDPFSYIGVEIGDQHYLVGQGAIEQDMKISWTGGDNKHTDDMFPVLLKTCLAILAEDDKMVVVEPLVMGLPVTAEADEKRHKLLEQKVLGTHKVKVTMADEKVLEREIYVKELITKKQPFGSFCDIVLDKTGDIKDAVIASQFNVIVDIGARTLNVYTLDNLEPVPDLCDTTNHGMYTAFNWVGDFIEDKLKQPVPSGKLTKIIQKGEIRGIDLSNVITRSYETLANEIRRLLETMFVDAWVFVDRIIFTGGGSEILKPWLERAFEGKGYMFLDRFATARGLRKYGMRHVKLNGTAVAYTIPSQGVKKVYTQ